MEIDSRFPVKLDAISDAPEPLRAALLETFSAGESVRLLVHSPAFSTATAKSPATVLAITANGWLVCAENEDGGEKLEVVFPSEEELAVSKAMESVLLAK